MTADPSAESAAGLKQPSRPACERSPVAQRILREATEFVRANGASALAVRPFAGSIGTTHRMVLHYFGSRDRLLAEVFQELRHEDVQHLTATHMSARELFSMGWQYYAAPENAFRIRMLLGLIGKAVAEDSGLEDFLDSLHAWTQVVVSAAEHDGYEDAAAKGRALVAGMRGLLIELHAHGDRTACDQSARILVDALFPPPPYAKTLRMYRKSVQAGPARRGAGSRLSRDAVLDAAAALADEKGFDAVSLRAVARRLGVTPMALYTYVDTREDLISLVIAHMISTRAVNDPWPSDAGDVLRELAHRLVSLIGEHPAIFQAYQRGGLYGDEAMTATEEILTSLSRSGLSMEDAMRAYTAVHLFALGFAAVRSAASARHEIPRPDPQRFPTLASSYEHCAALIEPEHLDESLEVLLDGVRARRHRRNPARH